MAKKRKTDIQRAKEFFDKTVIKKHLLDTGYIPVIPDDVETLVDFWGLWLSENSSEPTESLYSTVFKLLRTHRTNLYEHFVKLRTLKVHSHEHNSILYGSDKATTIQKNRSFNASSLFTIEDKDKVTSFFARKRVKNYFINNPLEITEDIKSKLNLLLSTQPAGYWKEKAEQICDIIYYGSSDYVASFNITNSTNSKSKEHFYARYGISAEFKYSKYLKEARNQFNKIAPSSLEHWLNLGFTEDEAIINRSIYQSGLGKANAGKPTCRTIEYWLGKGLSMQEAIERVASIQGRGFEFYESIYGEIKAETMLQAIVDKRLATWYSRPFEDRLKINASKARTYKQLVDEHGQEKANDIISKRMSNFVGNSKSSNLFFEKIDNILPIEVREKTVSAFKGNERFIVTGDKIYFVDYFYNNKIIEYYGSFWHCDPREYTSDYCHPVMDICAKQIWDKDNFRQLALKQLGYEILIIWSADVDNNITDQIQKCYDFLMNNK